MDDDTLRRAKKFDQSAIESMLAEHYPLVTRLTLALTGRQDTGTGIINYLMRRSLQQMARWEHADDATRWFSHHTILSARRATGHKAEAKHDTLRGPSPQPKYTAFLRALRELPQQQVEAFVLHDCEALDLRSTAVAMDCSTTAASTHLTAARQALQLISGEDYPVLAAAFRRTYEGLAPAEELRLPSVRKHVRRHLWPKRIRRIIILVVVVATIGAAAYSFVKGGWTNVLSP
jgi:DNA-directed RNA polymerase specialized sigma24 family protein